MLRIYLVARDGETDWDQTRAVVVAAESKDEARDLSGLEGRPDVTITTLGRALRTVKKGCILSDVKAG
jgi:hypothetical protein